MESNKRPAKKSLGQYWLDDPLSLEAMCVAANVRSGDTVLEVGPGTGELTQKLLETGANVVALEIDESLLLELCHRFQDYSSNQLRLETGDIRTYDLGSLPSPYKIVANIPYYLTSYLIRLVSETANPPEAAALLVQKEVAQRVAAKPGDMSLLSVTAQFYWQVSLGALVPAELFTPSPDVDSQVLILNRRGKPLFAVDEKRFFHLVKAGFSARRKKLRSSLAAGLRIDKPAAEELLNKAGVDPGERAQALALEAWHEIYKAAQAAGIV